MLGRVLTTAVLFAAVTIPARAQEKKITAADLPAAVRATAEIQSKGATVRGYSRETENGRVEYEVQLMVGGLTRDVSIGADGTVLEIEQQVPTDSLPPSVRAALMKKAGAGKITKVESLTKGGKLVAYEAAILTAGKRSEVQVGPDGTALTHEE
ncbi:MAG TPA: hypothetical protein VH163_03195 [Gemmatimonadales bacterium]|jgi:hypothetical protein|nr:hypothetical protein [Gemmatimonadales bacterium]